MTNERVPFTVEDSSLLIHVNVASYTKGWLLKRLPTCEAIWSVVVRTSRFLMIMHNVRPVI